jgi:hypothetical protein
VDLLPLQRALRPPTAVRGQASTLGGPATVARPGPRVSAERIALGCVRRLRWPGGLIQLEQRLCSRALSRQRTGYESIPPLKSELGLPVTVPSIHSCVSHLIRCQSVGKSLAYSCGLFSDQERLAPRLSSVLLTRVACFHLNPLIRLVVIDLLIPI